MNTNYDTHFKRQQVELRDTVHILYDCTHILKNSNIFQVFKLPAITTMTSSPYLLSKICLQHRMY